MENVINKFDNNYSFLSNFYPCNIEYDGLFYPSVENAYQASKTNDIELRKQFISITAGRAKRMGLKLEIIDNWDNIKLSVMKHLLYLKFENPELREKLLSTGDKKLIEGNCWGDTYWGVCNGIGENNLGKLLMNLRERLR
jgi:ribA/ribD-fused uncharacterized protein